MSRFVVTLAALAAVCSMLLVGGCASADSNTAAAPSAAAISSAALATSAKTAPSASANDLSSPPITEPRPFPQVTDLTAPPAVLDALKGKRAFFLVYYDPAQTVTADQKAVVAGLEAKYRGLIQFIPYDLPSTDLTDSATADKTAGQIAELAQRLDIGFMPAIVIVTRDGLITWQSTGYQDAGPLEREILRATR